MAGVVCLRSDFVGKTRRASSTGKRGYPIPATGKKGDKGRFITLKSGRVIFIPVGRQETWAEVKDRALAGKRKSLEELSRMKPESIRHTETGIEGAFVKDYGEDGKALEKTNTYGSADSELMAYEFSESIGWGIIPETIKTGPDTTMQRWVEGETAFSIEVGDPKGVMPREQLANWVQGNLRKESRMLIMDVLLQNGDRHTGNILVGADGKQWAIDNNQAFEPYMVWDRTKEAMRHEYAYGHIERWVSGTGVTRDYAGLIDAAKDVRAWHRTPPYWDYVRKLRETHGDDVARQFKENVRLMAEWSEKAEVVG